MSLGLLGCIQSWRAAKGLQDEDRMLSCDTPIDTLRPKVDLPERMADSLGIEPPKTVLARADDK